MGATNAAQESAARRRQPTMSQTPSFPLRFVPGVLAETVPGRPGMEYSETTKMGKRIERNAIVPMRDGKLLRTDLDSPEDADSPVAVLAAWSRLGKHGGSALALGRALSSGLVHPDPGGTQVRDKRRGSTR